MLREHVKPDCQMEIVKGYVNPNCRSNFKIMFPFELKLKQNSVRVRSTTRRY